MKRPIVRFRLNVTLSRTADRRKGWEEMVAVGMDDLELARLNQANTRDLLAAPLASLRLLFGPPRRL